MRYQAVRLQDRRDTVRMVLLGTLASLAAIAFLVFVVTTRGFIADSPAQSAFNDCVTEQFAASRDADAPFNWSQVQLSCTNRAINVAGHQLP